VKYKFSTISKGWLDKFKRIHNIGGYNIGVAFVFVLNFEWWYNIYYIISSCLRFYIMMYWSHFVIFFWINFSSLHINGHPKSIYIVKVEMFITQSFPNDQSTSNYISYKFDDVYNMDLEHGCFTKHNQIKPLHKKG
jgi:hypothetical protein